MSRRTAAIACALALTACSRAHTEAPFRLGYFPNVTHAQALVGVDDGTFARALPGKLETRMFNAGPAAMEALLAGDLDASYIGPGPVAIAFLRTQGQALRVVAGAVSGGAVLVEKDARAPADLAGKRVASPQLGNSQDVALRTWLHDHGLRTTTAGGGDVSIRPEDNGTTVQAFEQHALDGAWVPEPYAGALVAAGGKVLVDERALWPGGRFATTELVVRTDYLHAHPAIVQRLLQGQQDAIGVLDHDPARAEQLIGQAIQSATGQSVKASSVAAALPAITFTNDPIASSVRTQAQDAQRLGLLAKANLSGLFDLTILNGLLRKAGQPIVSS